MYRHDPQVEFDFDAANRMARRSDPETSHAAARSVVAKAAENRDAVLAVLRSASQPMIAESVASVLASVMSDERVRGCLSELEKLGRVVVLDRTGTTSRGRRCGRYVAR